MSSIQTELIIPVDSYLKNTEILKWYLSLEERKGILDVEIQRVKNSLYSLWETTNFQPEDILTFVQASEFVFHVNLSVVDAMFQKSGTPLLRSDKAKGRKGYFEKFVQNYHRYPVHNQFKNLFKSLGKEEISLLEDSPSSEMLISLIHVMGFEQVYWLTSQSKNKESLQKRLKSEFQIEYLDMLADLYTLFLNSEFDMIMNEPHHLAEDEMLVDPNMLLQERKILEKNFNRVQKQQKQLKKELYFSTVKEKELKGEIYKLLNESLEEIENLKIEKEKQYKDFFEERQMYIELIQQLREKASTDTNKESVDSAALDLDGRKIAVVGGNRERHYAEVIEKYNGTLVFVAEDDIKKIKGAVSKSDVVFFLVELCGHRQYKQTMAASKSFKVPFIFVNSKGISDFEKDLQIYMANIEN